jgi:hypothetical protein
MKENPIRKLPEVDSQTRNTGSPLVQKNLPETINIRMTRTLCGVRAWTSQRMRPCKQAHGLITGVWLTLANGMGLTFAMTANAADSGLEG